MLRRTHALTESLSRGALKRLCALLVLGLTLAACGSSDPDTTTIQVQVQSLAGTASKLVVAATLDSKPAMQTQDVTGDLTHFGVRLPASMTGTLTLTVSAYDSAQCRIASGSVDVMIGAPYRLTATVTMMTLATPECPVTPLPAATCTTTFCWTSPLPQGNAYLGLWVNSATDAWAVGPVGTITHYKDAPV